MWWFDDWSSSDSCYIYIDSTEYKYTNPTRSSVNEWGNPGINDFKQSYTLTCPHTANSVKLEFKAGFGSVSSNTKSWGLSSILALIDLTIVCDGTCLTCSDTTANDCKSCPGGSSIKI
jgi:hypothetical protein